MNNIDNDKRIILTLDAGGTNFVFSAIQGNEEIVNSIRRPSNAHNLGKCIDTIIEGFDYVNNKLLNKACAISFAFPGPADYNKGVIGDLPNFKAFNGNVPLGPILEEKFNCPVFINNDGNLFAYGEALSGYLPELNNKIINAGGIKQFSNLIGITLGTGFGCGVVLNNILLKGDNSCDTGIHNTLNKYNLNWNAEESVSTRALQRVYAEESGLAFTQNLMPKDIYYIAKGLRDGNQKAAIESFNQFGEALGSSLANILTLIDGIVVIGGGITSAWDIFSPAMFNELNRSYENFEAVKSHRLSVKVYNLEDKTCFNEFALGSVKNLSVSGSKRIVSYDEIPRIGIGISDLGASKAIALGAYTYALQQLDRV
ncbi:MAG: ROK family protein [Bacteroidetes bacterium]|nr:MAG: ROK family protein [Bacteroidota bacterium]